jgi:predicted membrane-bound spermidine synthase/Flp pilus assembly protein TadD
VYFLFFLSGISGLVYQVIWVRVFGNVFGNTIYSASLVVALFMLGLGVGSWAFGAWSDRRYTAQPQSLLRAYGYVELMIGMLGLGISLLLPHLAAISAFISSYSRDANGWYSLSPTSYLLRGVVAVVLLAPITLLMGGTLTLLIRQFVRSDPQADRWKIAILYGVNTAGAAVGCLMTDFSLVPLAGLQITQAVAVSLNLIAGAGALLIARSAARARPSKSRRAHADRSMRAAAPSAASRSSAWEVAPIVVALAITGFAAMGMEIVWFRHLTILLGAFRSVFSLLLTVILIGIAAGSLMCAFVERRIIRPTHWLMAVQALFVTCTLLGLAVVDVAGVDRAPGAVAYFAAQADSLPFGLALRLSDVWFNARPMLLAVLAPALLMGFSFPLANAITQRAEHAVGRRAGVLYLANTLGAVAGSLASGFVFLPWLGIQSTASLLMVLAGLAVVPLFIAAGTTSSQARLAFSGSLVASGVAIALWLFLPGDYVVMRALPPLGSSETLVSLREGLNEVISVTESPDTGRTLMTNGHPMSSTRRLSQRYMRALAHVPLLSMDRPESVLVIGFGVGNTVHAASLHPTVRSVELADLSKDILDHSRFFADAHHDVLRDPRVTVYVNDGRHHLHMRPPGSYDLITLEPPPIGYAGVAALYSREFYALARTRLKAKGYVSQWLPAYQVPTATTLAMIRAFVDVFPQAVLLSGAEADLLLIGTKDTLTTIDPGHVANAIAAAPTVAADLRRLNLGTVREIVGTFVGSAQTLQEATHDTPAVTDDHPVQEYGVFSLLNQGNSVPASVVDLTGVGSWCPACFADGRPSQLVEGLDTYLALLDRAYSATAEDVAQARRLSRAGREIAGSAYLGAVVPESTDVHDILGVGFASRGAFGDAIKEFRAALGLDPRNARAHWHLGRALVSSGRREDGIEHLRTSVQLDSVNGQAHYDLAIVLLQEGQVGEAIDHLRATVRLMPNLVGAHNNLGIALASQGQVDEAIRQFQAALALDPDSAETRHNLSLVTEGRSRVGSP